MNSIQKYESHPRINQYDMIDILMIGRHFIKSLTSTTRHDDDVMNYHKMIFWHSIREWEQRDDLRNRGGSQKFRKNVTRSRRGPSDHRQTKQPIGFNCFKLCCVIRGQYKIHFWLAVGMKYIKATGGQTNGRWYPYICGSITERGFRVYTEWYNGRMFILIDVAV